MEQKLTITAEAATEVDRRGGAGRMPLPGAALVRALGPGRILALGAVALALLGFFAYVIMRATESPYTLLFSGLELTDAQQLVGRLDALKVPYRLSPNGDAIMVPADEALRLRMSLAEEGLPVGRTVGYELFDRANPFTTSDFLGNVTLQRAIEGELARTIATLHGVRAARVHIVEPKRSLFGREEVRATASIVVSLRRPGALEKQEVAGIRHLVAAAVPGLDPGAVTILDDAGNLLAEPSGPNGSVISLDETEEHRVAFENRLRSKIIQLLERTVGAGKVDAAVSADLDFDEVATMAEQFDPDGQVVRSTQSTEEARDSKENAASEAVTVANNLPTERQAAEPGPKSSDRSNRKEETVNYEISRTVRNQTKRGTTVRRLSIAVQVDGTYREQPDGTKAYEPRSAEELAQIAALVRSAAGIDDGRGDRLEIASRPFAPVELPETPEPSWQDHLPIAADRLIELAAFGVLTVLVLLFGVRPLLARLLPRAENGQADAAAPSWAGADGKPLLSGDGRAAPGEAITTQDAARLGGKGPSATSPAIAHGSAVASRIGEEGTGDAAEGSPTGRVLAAVDADPERAVRVIRAWLHAS
ncbi:flagellar basal-body MS-ring/collar protein FliF [Benzoatithermus flavus]|uniref:Flagellar M-ring protein n=1 Tax=Benzoatithermus flavus TaxID=3108223 RepID=A0ABU8XPX8_9PROT